MPAKRASGAKGAPKRAPAKRPAKAAKRAARATPGRGAKKASTARRPGAKAAKTARKSSSPARPVKVAKAEGAGPVHAYIAKLPGWQADFLRRFDDLVAREVPGAVRAVKWSAPFYGVPGQGWFASTKGFSRHVKILFFRGTSLRPVPPSGEHEQGRALDLREGDAFDGRQVAEWVRQAAALPGWGNA